jgi:hypothetical protein
LRRDQIASGFLRPRDRTEQGIADAIKIAVHAASGFLRVQGRSPIGDFLRGQDAEGLIAKATSGTVTTSVTDAIVEPLSNHISTATVAAPGAVVATIPVTSEISNDFNNRVTNMCVTGHAL